MLIGERIDDNNKQIQIGCGYDHAFILNDTKNQIKLNDIISGRNMIIDTDQDCVVIYSMNFPDDCRTLQMVIKLKEDMEYVLKHKQHQ